MCFLGTNSGFSFQPRVSFLNRGFFRGWKRKTYYWWNTQLPEQDLRKERYDWQLIIPSSQSSLDSSLLLQNQKKKKETKEKIVKKMCPWNDREVL